MERVKTTKQDRINTVNAIIDEIATRGRKFFQYQDRRAKMILHNSRLCMVNEYNEKIMNLSTKNGYPPKGWTHGGTLWGLTKDFKRFIHTGEYSNHFNGYGGLYCPHWGYPEEDMKAIQDKGIELGYLQTPN